MGATKALLNPRDASMAIPYNQWKEMLK